MKIGSLCRESSPTMHQDWHHLMWNEKVQILLALTQLQADVSHMAVIATNWPSMMNAKFLEEGEAASVAWDI